MRDKKVECANTLLYITIVAQATGITYFCVKIVAFQLRCGATIFLRFFL